MSFFKKLSAGFKSPESPPHPPPASDSSSPAPHSAPAPSSISDSPQQTVARPFEFWTSNLNEQSVAEAKSKFLDLNAKDPYGEPALIRAARHGDAAVTKALLEAGAEINISDSSGETAVSWAAQMGKTEVLAILIASPEVHLEKSDKGGRTALYDACCCQFRYISVLQVLYLSFSLYLRSATLNVSSYFWTGVRSQKSKCCMRPLTRRVWHAS
jgi:hypothetical protein